MMKRSMGMMFPLSRDSARLPPILSRLAPCIRWKGSTTLRREDVLEVRLRLVRFSTQ